MKKVAFLAVIALMGFAVTGFAQQNAATALLDSPYKAEAELANVGETVSCTLAVGTGSTSLFGLDQFLGTTPREFMTNDLFTFQVFQIDENCAFITSWTVGFGGTTMTGITYDEANGNMWVCDPFGAVAVVEYTMAGVATGVAWPFPAGYPGIWGPLARDNNVVTPAKSAWFQCIAADWYIEMDLTNGYLYGSFGNPDNTSGAGAYGNGCSEAADPSACAGTTMLVSSGLGVEGQVTRTTQMDDSGVFCYNTWDVKTVLTPYGETFVNGIEEYYGQGGDKRLMISGNATGVMYNMGRPVGITDCQGIDSPDSDVVYVNSGNGGITYTVPINNLYPISWAIQDVPTPLGSKFVVHQNAGIPSSATVGPLPAGLGVWCFPLLIPPFGSANPECIWSNLGKTNKIGASKYFAGARSNPAKAPTFMELQPAGDSFNMTLGSQHTVQGIILNGAATSPKNASATNAIIIDVTAGV